MQKERQPLINDLKNLSVKKGEEFILSSGQKSDIYIDVKQTMLYGPTMHNLANLLYEHSKLFGWYHAVAGVPLGGAHLATMVAMASPCLNVILIRKELKEHGTQKWIEDPPCDLFKKVILFEDVITTGHSALAAAKMLKKHGYDIRGVMAVVDRRADKAPTLGEYGFRALVDFEELI